MKQQQSKLESVLIALAYKCADCMGYERMTKHCQDDIAHCAIECPLKPYRIEAVKLAASSE